MTETIHAYAAMEAGKPLVPYTYEVGALTADEVQVKVEYCGVCHSDMSMANNDWHITSYPLIPGHEVIGIVESIGPNVKSLKPGMRVGIGWHASYCGSCMQCHSGDNNLCATAQALIVGHHGGMAQKVRAFERAVIPIPEGCNPQTTGPLLCGGITVFTPLVEYGISPLDHVGVVGIGGLGHIALKFLNAWGCKVTAFTSSQAKAEEARSFGAHHVVSSVCEKEIGALAGQLTMILVTVNVELKWQSYIDALAPRGRLHFVGVAPPVSVSPFLLLVGMKQISGSPTGNPQNIKKMLDFCARHKIEPKVEEFPLADCNKAFEKIHQNSIKFRAVLKM